jgi:transcriptional regulator with XRE-family HTH domain
LSRRILRGFNRATLAQARTAAGLSRQDLARLARTGRATIDNWETGRATPQIDVLVRVAEVLHVRVDTLIDIPTDQRYPGDWRILRGLTQPQLATATGLSTTTIGAIERGEVALSDTNADTIAKELNITATTYRQAYERARTRPPGTPA